MSDINPGQIKFVKYSPMLMPLIKDSKFDCGNNDLNDFLKEELESHREYMLTQSTLILYEEKRIIGYFSLRTDAIKLSDNEKEPFRTKGLGHKDYPAIKIGRLAIDKEFQSKDIGTLALKAIFGIIRANHENIASRFVTVDSKKDPRTLKFYMEKHKFIENEFYNKDPKKETLSLRYDLFNPP